MFKCVKPSMNRNRSENHELVTQNFVLESFVLLCILDNVFDSLALFA